MMNEIDPTLATEAIELVTGPRATTYGPPTINFQRITDGWTVIFENGVDPKRVALAMVWAKICRELHTPKRDNIVDAIGYLLTYDACRQHDDDIQQWVDNTFGTRGQNV